MHEFEHEADICEGRGLLHACNAQGCALPGCTVLVLAVGVFRHFIRCML